MIEIRTSCDTCSRTRKDDPIPELPPGAIAGFRDCVQWPGLDATPPAVGTRHRLDVSFPFLASDQLPFWVLFQPSGADAPDEALCLVRCQLRGDLGPYVGTWPADQAYRPERTLDVEVLEVLPVLALPSRLPVDPESPFDDDWDRLFEPGGCRSADAAELGPFTYLSADVEGDVGAVAICVATPAGRSVVLFSAWSMCDDGWFVALNHPLDDTTYQQLRSRFTDAAT